MIRAFRLGLTFIVASFVASAAMATVVYDNTSPGNIGITTTSAGQLGDEITAAPGTSRTITEIDIGVTSQSTASTANLQAFFYANDGAGGAPGTLLWQSALMPSVSINSFNFLYAFAVPSVLVPDTFTWTMAITNIVGNVGFVPAAGTSIGSTLQPWVGSPGSFIPLSQNFQVQARITALSPSSVPEPESLVLVGLGFVALGVRATSQPRVNDRTV